MSNVLRPKFFNHCRCLKCHLCSAEMEAFAREAGEADEEVERILGMTLDEAFAMHKDLAGSELPF